MLIVVWCILDFSICCDMSSIVLLILAWSQDCFRCGLIVTLFWHCIIASAKMCFIYTFPTSWNVLYLMRGHLSLSEQAPHSSVVTLSNLLGFKIYVVWNKQHINDWMTFWVAVSNVDRMSGTANDNKLINWTDSLMSYTKKLFRRTDLICSNV